MISSAKAALRQATERTPSLTLSVPLGATGGRGGVDLERRLAGAKSKTRNRSASVVPPERKREWTVVGNSALPSSAVAPFLSPSPTTPSLSAPSTPPSPKRLLSASTLAHPSAALAAATQAMPSVSCSPHPLPT